METQMSYEANFKPGDQVTHKDDDGQAMTVTSVTGGKVCCEWYDQTMGEHKSREFAGLVLEKYKGLIIA
jgi:uncharacterized protein YodC (DUF2158 family)